MNLFAIFIRPRLTLAVIALLGIGLLAFALYLQHSVGLEPCPMCIMQRYAFTLVIIFAGLGAIIGKRWGMISMSVLGQMAALAGAGTAARHSYLQMFPQPNLSCGRDLFDIVNSFEFGHAFRLIFRGTGECAKIDWTFLGLSIAQWSFLWLVAMSVLFSLALYKSIKLERKIF